MAASVTANTGAAFLGGAQKRNLLPPDVNGAIAAAQTAVANPIGGVDPSPLKRARQNPGSSKPPALGHCVRARLPPS